MNFIKQMTAHKRRIAVILLEDKECDIHLEILSCEKQINDIVRILSDHYCMKQIFVNRKDNE